MNDGVIAELQKRRWAMEPLALDAFVRQMVHLSALSVDMAALQAQREEPASRMKVEDGIAIVPVTGVLVKGAPWFLRLFGIGLTTFDEIRRDVTQALRQKAVKSILLHVDSPGGDAEGAQETADLIFAARSEKPVAAYIDDMGVSGAYWLASQGVPVTANETAQVGSVGVYMVVVDSSARAEKEGIEVKLSRSGEHKGGGYAGVPITDEQVAALQEVVDDFAGVFVSAVARGRGVSRTLVAELASGRVWLAGRARELGLIDTVGGFDDALAAARQAQGKGGMAMSEEDVQAGELEAARVQAAAEGQEAERQRVVDLFAAFPADPGFAATQAQAGASVEQAKAAYADVLAERVQTGQQEVERLQTELDEAKAAPPVDGAVPVPHGGEADEEGDADFMAVARERAKGDGIGITQAMKLVAAEQPELHSGWVASQKPIQLRNIA